MSRIQQAKHRRASSPRVGKDVRGFYAVINNRDWDGDGKADKMTIRIGALTSRKSGRCDVDIDMPQEMGGPVYKNCVAGYDVTGKVNVSIVSSKAGLTASKEINLYNFVPEGKKQIQIDGNMFLARNAPQTNGSIALNLPDLSKNRTIMSNQVRVTLKSR